MFTIFFTRRNRFRFRCYHIRNLLAEFVLLAFGVLNLQLRFAIESTFAYKSKHVFEEQNHLLFILYQFFHISCSLVKNWLDIYPHFKIYILFCIYEIMTCNIKQLFLLYKLLNTFIVSVYYIYKFLNNIVDAKPPQKVWKACKLTDFSLNLMVAGLIHLWCIIME